MEQKLNEKLLKDRYERAESMDVFAEIGTPPELEDGEEEEPLTDVDQDSEPETEEPDIEEFVGLLTEEAKGAKLFTLFSLNIYKCIFIVFSCA